MEIEQINRYVGSKIKEHRKYLGMSQEELAKKIGVGKTTISNYEVGLRSPKKPQMIKLSEVFGISIDDLFPTIDSSKNSVSATLSEINKISSQLQESRQKIVLETANAQLKEQNEEETRKNKVVRLKKKRLTDEELWEVIEHGVANDGSEQTEYEKQFFFNLLRENLDNDDEYED